jgi:uncharacterized protein (DUF362 family)
MPYPDFPYAPGEAYPELTGTEVGPPNPVFAAVRRCLFLAGLDREHFGQPAWNPLGDLIEPGQKVLIKPNWVRHDDSVPSPHRGRGDSLPAIASAAAGGEGENAVDHDGQAGGLSALVTHPAVLRPVLAYVLVALKGSGRVILGDAPIQSADFDRLMRQLQVPRLVERMEVGRVAIEIRDFRENVCQLDEQGRVAGHLKRSGDPDGTVTVDLAGRSRHVPVEAMSERFRVTNYDPAAMRAHHAAGRHEYLIARAVLNADAVINVPKLKTHRKAGLTCCLKNVVGINGSKDYLPHHRLGPSTRGGDEYEWPSVWKSAAARLTDRLEAAAGQGSKGGQGAARLALRLCGRMARLAARDGYNEGSWYGNDTIWRTAMDLSAILEFARPDGTLGDVPQRRVFNVVDAVVAGGGEGPLRPTPVHAAMILAGAVPAAVDFLAARLVGLDPLKIPLIRAAVDQLCAGGEVDSDAERGAAARMDLRLVSDEEEASGHEVAPEYVRPRVCLVPPAGWAGHVELAACPSAEGIAASFAESVGDGVPSRERKLAGTPGAGDGRGAGRSAGSLEE